MSEKSKNTQMFYFDDCPICQAMKQAEEKGAVVGGPVDIAVITPKKGFVWVQKKNLRVGDNEIDLETISDLRQDGKKTNIKMKRRKDEEGERS